MKKTVIVLAAFCIIIFMAFLYIVNKDTKYEKKLYKQVTTHTEIKNIDYINYYNEYYIVKNDSYIYILDKKFEEKTKEDIVLVHENNNNYALIYENDKIMYLEDKLKKGHLTYNYYDIHDYNLIKTITIGG